MQVKLIIVTCCVLSAYAGSLPADVPKCRYGDSECIRNVANTVIQNKFGGHPGLNLVSVDPIYINAIDIRQGGESPVNIDLNFKNIELRGLRNSQIVGVKGFQPDPNGQYEIQFQAPSLSVIGPYKVNGRVLLLPLQGDGNSNLTLTDVNAVVRFTGTGVEKKGKQYLQMDNFKLSFDISRMYLDLSNLFNGDKALGDNTNLFLNENWQDIFNELKPAIFDAFGLVIKQIIQGTFNKVPYSELLE